MSVYDITLSDPTEQVAPPTTVLRVTAVDDLAFITIEKYDEEFNKRTLTTVAEMVVSLPALREVVDLLSHDRDREDLRTKDKHGEPGARIGGTRMVVAPL